MYVNQSRSCFKICTALTISVTSFKSSHSWIESGPRIQLKASLQYYPFSNYYVVDLVLQWPNWAGFHFSPAQWARWARRSSVAKAAAHEPILELEWTCTCQHVFTHSFSTGWDGWDKDDCWWFSKIPSHLLRNIYNTVSSVDSCN